MSTNGQHVDDQQQAIHAVYHSIHHTHKTMQEMVKLLQAQLVQLGIGGDVVDRDLENWPVPGITRKVLSNRRVSGTDSFSAPAATALLVVPALPGRLGGTIVNSGSNSCILYLALPGQVSSISAGTGAIFLAASGGSWDFRLGAAPWDGPVSVISTNGTTLTVAQA